MVSNINKDAFDVAFSAAMKVAKNHTMHHIEDTTTSEAYLLLNRLFLDGQPEKNAVDEMELLIESVLDSAISAYENHMIGANHISLDEPLSNKIDRVKQVLSMNLADDKEAICMILSGYITHGSGDGALVHVKAFPNVAIDIERYYKEKQSRF